MEGTVSPLTAAAPSSTLLEAAKSASLLLGAAESTTLAAIDLARSVEGGDSSAASRSTGSAQEEATLALTLSDLLPSIFGPTVANGLLNSSGMPQPFSGGLPVAAAGSGSGGSAPSSGGNGFSMAAILAVLSVLLLGGKSLVSAREFLRPDSILSLALEHPG
jgi:hypothetical protein